MNRRLRLGWIGAGGFAQWGLLPCLRDCANIEFVALADLDPERARLAAERYGAQRWYNDGATLLGGEQLDALAIIGPPTMALEMATACLERGLPVYMEKPLGYNEAQARALAAVAAQHGAVGQVGFNWRHAPSFRKAHDLIRTSEFGAPTYIESRHHEPVGADRVWECVDEAQSWLLLHGIHAVDQLRYQFGEVREVYSRVATRPNSVVLTSSVLFVNGATGWLTLHGGFPHTDCSMFAVGDRLCSVGTRNFETLEWRSRERHPYAPAELGNDLAGYGWHANFTENRQVRMGYRQELESFAEAVLGGVEPMPSLADAALSMRLCDAIYRSAVEGVAVRL